MTARDATPASVHVLGAVCGVTAEGSIVDVPSASQRRLLGLLAVHAPRQLRAEWLADVLGVTTGALRTTVSRLRTTIGSATLRTASTGYSLEGDVDATQFCSAVANADKATDKLGALEQALTLWTGPVLEEFQGEEWARGETARLTEIHAASVDDYVDQLISAHRETDAIAVAEGQIAQYPVPRSVAWPADPGPRACRPPGRRPTSLPDVPIAAGRRVRHRALTRGRPDRASGGDRVERCRRRPRVVHVDRGNGHTAAGLFGTSRRVRRSLHGTGGAPDCSWLW